MHERLVTDPFRRAAQDYRYLIEKHYARGSALKIVGDRYQLGSNQRSMLYRGVTSSEEAALRGAKLTTKVSARRLCIDGLNVLYTIANYLCGRVLFISTDGWLRDAAEVHGAMQDESLRWGDVLDAAVDYLIGWTADKRPNRVEIYIDEPVSLSGRLAARLRHELSEAGIAGTATTVRSADYPLKRTEDAVVATSDSSIIDACRCMACDAARQVLVGRFDPAFVDLREILGDASINSLS